MKYSRLPGRLRWHGGAIQPTRPPEPSGQYAIAIVAGAPALMMVLATTESLLGYSASPLTWYLTRASGFTLYLLLWLSVCLGLGITAKLFDRFVSRAVIYSVHTFATQLAYGLLGLHILALVLDSHVSFSIRQIVIPFGSEASEPWTGLGVIAMYLLAVVGMSGVLRRFVSFRAWKAIHMLTFPLYLLALGHGIGAGSDSTTPAAFALYLMTASLVAWLTGYRLFRWNRRAETATYPKPSTPFDRFAPQVRQ